ncbi:hypothetical protein EVAR_78362_1 [Eumeta japonica]|uniref:Uncharacterized protein n=1 Tax=Eumeta variegata TaxID=151549 RepID=A0A4C1T3K8_EUMVA|nr:hypothetical protein EVAR_78362_1 [Eumeta japonica]
MICASNVLLQRRPKTTVVLLMLMQIDKSMTYQQIWTNLGLSIEKLAHSPYRPDSTPRHALFIYLLKEKKNFEETGLRTPRKQWFHMKRPSKRPLNSSGETPPHNQVRGVPQGDNCSPLRPQDTSLARVSSDITHRAYALGKSLSIGLSLSFVTLREKDSPIYVIKASLLRRPFEYKIKQEQNNIIESTRAYPLRCAKCKRDTIMFCERMCVCVHMTV